MWTQVTSAGFEILVKWPMFFIVPYCGINTKVTFQPKLFFCHLGQRYIFKDSCDRSKNEKLPKLVSLRCTLTAMAIQNMLNP